MWLDCGDYEYLLARVMEIKTFLVLLQWVTEAWIKFPMTAAVDVS